MTMQRRDFLRTGTAAALAARFGMRLASAQETHPNDTKQQVAQADVHTVYVFAKCHLDMGFTDFEHGVVTTYFEDGIAAVARA